MADKYGPMSEGDADWTPQIRKAILGWTIVEVGMTYEKTYQDGGKGSVEGGLTLILEKKGKKRKVILGYTELGEWLEYKEDLK